MFYFGEHQVRLRDPRKGDFLSELGEGLRRGPHESLVVPKYGTNKLKTQKPSQTLQFNPLCLYCFHRLMLFPTPKSSAPGPGRGGSSTGSQPVQRVGETLSQNSRNFVLPTRPTYQKYDTRNPSMRCHYPLVDPTLKSGTWGESWFRRGVHRQNV